MKKKILIIMPSMFIGGAERSLLGLLENIDYQKYEVSLFLYRQEGDFLRYIPKQVILLPEISRYRTFDVPIKSLLFGRNTFFGMARIISKIALRMHCVFSKEKPGIWMSMQYTAGYLQPLLPEIPGEYDLGIMFLGIADTLINKVNAKKKITWNHTDYDILFPDEKKDLKTFSQVDAVISVSDACTEKLIKRYPTLKNKAMTIENCLAVNHIREQAKAEIADMPKKQGEWILLSIGRYTSAKNFDNIPDICSRIRNRGINIKWYIIGYGAEESLIRQKIQQFHMEEHVILLGKRDNPYPYIANCDIYVQPSRYEGKCVSVIEAQVLKKPVVITNYETAVDQLENNVDGVIVPMDNERCAEGIIRLLLDPDKMNALSEACSKKQYSNVDEINKIYRFMEGEE